MHAEIVMIGTELLLGQIVDSNAAHIGRILAENGIALYQKTTVGDNRARIARALEAALSRADVVLTSGGLGPTEDDLTREALSDVFRKPLVFHPAVWEELVQRFSFFRRNITENNKKQAFAPEGAAILPNPNGTAPGLICGDERGDVICMPGVPHELFAMLEDQVVPYIRRKFNLTGLLHHRVLKICGVGESWVDSKMGDLMATLENPTIGVLANPESVRIRITARADSVEEANAMIDAVARQIEERMPGLILGADDATLEGVVDAMLRERGWRMAVGESFSGGLIGQRLVAAGAASYAGGTVRPPTQLDGDPKAAARVFARQVLDTFEADCGLGVVTDTARRMVYGAFLTPEGDLEFESGYPALDANMQLRAAVICLERVRRHLVSGPARGEARIRNS